MLPSAVLIPSPLTGPMPVRGVCDALWRLGHRAYVMPLTSTDYLVPPYWMTQAATVAASLPEEGEVVLVGLGGAGALLPAIGRFSRNRQGARVTGYLFIDCDLPRDGYSRFDLMEDEASRSALRRGQEPGFLARLGASQLEPIMEDEETGAAFLAQVPRIPLELYEERIGVPDDWPDAPCGYLGLSTGHPGALRRSRARGWTVHEIAGHNLLPLTDPQRVALAIAELIQELGAMRHAG